ncbi:MAG: hypothetical protein WB810_01680, partial [Candidatus Cybelea sp.]
MNAAEPCNECCVDAIGFCSQHLALGERFDAHRVHQTDKMAGLAKREREIFAPTAGGFEARMDPLNLAIAQP